MQEEQYPLCDGLGLRITCVAVFGHRQEMQDRLVVQDRLVILWLSLCSEIQQDFEIPPESISVSLLVWNTSDC